MEDQHLGQTKDKEDNNDTIRPIRPIAENNTQNDVQCIASYTSDSIPNGTASHTKPSNNTSSKSVMSNVNVILKPSLATTTTTTTASLPPSTAVASATMTSTETRSLPTSSSHTTTTASTSSDKPSNVNVNVNAAAGNSTVSSSSTVSASLSTTATATIIHKRKAIEPPHTNGDNDDIKLNKDKSLPDIATKKQKMDDNESASKTNIRKTTGDAIVEFDLEFLTPCGRYSIELYEHFFRMRGQKYDYKIKYDDISRFFLLPKPDDIHMAFVIALNKPIRQGQHRYQYLVLQTNKDPDKVRVKLDEDTLKKEYGDDLQPIMRGSLSNLVAKTFKVIAKKKVFIPGKFSRPCVKCAFRANKGLLYPLDKQLVFIHKPPLLIRFNEVKSVEFQQYAGGQGSTGNFDLCVTLKASAASISNQQEFVFSGIDRSNYTGLYNFLSTKSICIKNLQEISGAVEQVAPVYNEDEIYGGPTKKQKMDDNESAPKTTRSITTTTSSSGDSMNISSTKANVQEGKNNALAPNDNSTSVSDSRKQQSDQKKEDDGNVPSEEKKKIITKATAASNAGPSNKSTIKDDKKVVATASSGVSFSSRDMGKSYDKNTRVSTMQTCQCNRCAGQCDRKVYRYKKCPFCENKKCKPASIQHPEPQPKPKSKSKAVPIVSTTKKSSSSDKSSSTTSSTANNNNNRKRSSSPKPPPQVAAIVASTKKKENNGTEVVSLYTTFPTLKIMSDPGIRPLRSLSTAERIQLERLFEFDNGANDETWDEHFMGVLALTNSNEVENPDGREGERSKKRSLLEWVGINTEINDSSTDNNNDGTSIINIESNNSLELISHVLRHVYNYKNVPKQAKLILANIDMNSPESIAEAISRLSIDPIVLQQDGWTTTKASEPMGASGGAYRIGEKIWWQGYVGVVIAFVHDNDMGDLWKGMWIEDLLTFDLEPEELADSRKKYERKKAAQSSSDQKRKLTQGNAKVKFDVDGIEHGIILATSFARGARHGVFWPARVMHASELVGVHSKRGRNKKKVDVVFLAPYWNSNHAVMKNGGGGGGGRRVEALSDSVLRHGEALFSSGPLFEVEITDADEASIQRYPYDAESGLDIDSLRLSFKLMGLPKDAFSRFLDSHRLALGFRTFSQSEMKSTRASDSDRAAAALLEGHPLAVHTAHFPASALQLPFIHMLSQLPHHEKQTFRPKAYSGDMAKGEPALQFGRILDSMKPPACWGLNSDGTSEVKESPQFYSTISSPVSFSRKGKGSKDDPYDTGRFIVGLSSLHSLLSENSHTSNILKNSLNELVIADAKCSSLQQIHGSEARNKYLRSMNRTWIIVKSQGETLIASLKKDKYLMFLKDWRRCCERIYKHINTTSGSDSVSWVITDSRCNLHLTSSDCYERAVRLPAALKGARQAKGNIRIINTVGEQYLDLAENDVIRRAHKMSYIDRIKKRCLAATEDDVVALTDDSDGNGGEDTKGSKGTWNAAISGVGAALQGVDMIMNGECLNAFCATRPPGHHAGRELHAMKAVSNGFCILNTVACAALYATAPILQGGLGLSRVCIIDIDVHHGNGTQDILCSTYDPRFLYVSMHAGGPDINGVDFEDDNLDQLEHHLGGNPKKGIFPGRCGDISPHKGVLNIPLGGRVTPHALGTALVTKVTPTVDKFNPELIIISAGFDAHKNDPLNMGGLTAEDFGTLTEVVCKLAYKCCSGRVLSVLEGGYGVPCCRPQNFPEASAGMNTATNADSKSKQAQSVQLECLELGADLPPYMTDVISSYALQKRLDKCHQEGFIHCVTEHVSALARCNAVPR